MTITGIGELRAEDQRLAQDPPERIDLHDAILESVDVTLGSHMSSRRTEIMTSRHELTEGLYVRAAIVGFKSWLQGNFLEMRQKNLYQ